MFRVCKSLGLFSHSVIIAIRQNDKLKIVLFIEEIYDLKDAMALFLLYICTYLL